MLQRLLIALCLLAAASPVCAGRMYQWIDARTGTTQMSGRPPAWYRTERPGPRVFVFENGQIIDDTARTVETDERAALRAQALRSADVHYAAAAGAAAPDDGAAPAADAELQALLPGGEDFDLDALLQAAPQAATPAPAATETDAQLTRLKALIQAWDRQQTARARSVIDSARTPP
ncbi:MAG: hypothetical protein IT495_13810 [Gammaproteobacteria bacterium]|nr:hypothetical protein [Gammaproteobacteria bacterium]